MKGANGIDGSRKRRGADGRIANEIAFDGAEHFPKPGRGDEAVEDHGFHVTSAML